MRLRNRMVKADFYTDPDLLQWPRGKRDLYRSLWAMAEDSYCIEDSPFGWKVTAWPSPLDTDMSVEAFTAWRDELVEDGKLISYEADGKRYLFLPDMARHEKPRNPQSPNMPLPSWVKWVTSGSDQRKGSYEFDNAALQDAYNDLTTTLTSRYNNATTLPALPCPVLPCPDLSCSGYDEDETDEQRQASRFIAVFSVWERVICAVPSQNTKKTLRSWVTMGYSDSAIEAALKVAVEQGAKSPAQYATSVLRNGITEKPVDDEPYADLGRVF